MLEKFGLASIKHLAQVFLLSLAAGNLITGLLKGIGFAYWRYFQSFRYLLIMGGLWLHYNIEISFGEKPWINCILFYFCMGYVAMYVVDFAWFVGVDKLDQQSSTNKAVATGMLFLSSALLAGKMSLFVKE